MGRSAGGKRWDFGRGSGASQQDGSDRLGGANAGDLSIRCLPRREAGDVHTAGDEHRFPSASFSSGYDVLSDRDTAMV